MSPLRLPAPPPLRQFPQERARRTHEKLLASAGALFMKHGFRSVQVPEIARDAGLSVGAFYRYFDDKRAIVLELIHVVLERNRLDLAQHLDDWRARLVGGEATGFEFVEHFVRLAARHQEVPAHLLRTFVALSYEDAEVGALRHAYDESERHDMARFLRATTSRQRVPSPLAAARLVDMTTEEAIRWSSIEGGHVAREIRSALVNMLARYLFGDDSEG